jgi:hypothetical protein
VNCCLIFSLFSTVFLFYTWYNLYNKTCNNIYVRKKLADFMFVYCWTTSQILADGLNSVTCLVETRVPLFALVKRVLILCSNSKF